MQGVAALKFLGDLRLSDFIRFFGQQGLMKLGIEYGIFDFDGLHPLFGDHIQQLTVDHSNSFLKIALVAFMGAVQGSLEIIQHGK